MKLTPTLGGAYSGSVGGLTASHNTGGQYLRRRSVPTNPNTMRQQHVRSLIGALTQAWTDAMTPAQREAWRTYGANVPYTDTLGQTITMSGLNAYIKANMVRMQWIAETQGNVPDARLDDAPVVFNTGEPPVVVSTFGGDFTTPPGTLTVQGQLASGASDDGDAYLFIAPPQTAGTRFYKGPYQLAATTEVAAAADAYSFTAIDLSDAMEWASDTVPVPSWDGLEVPLRIIMVYDDGRVSEELRGLFTFTDASS